MSEIDLDLLLTQGLNAFQAGDNLKALQKFEKILNDFGTDNSVAEAAAYTANLTKDWDRAAKHWLTVSNIDPKRPGPFQQYISALLRGQRYKEAEAFLKSSEVLQTNVMQYNSHLFTIYLAQGKLADAVTVSQKNYQLEPNDKIAIKYATLFCDYKYHSECQRWIDVVSDKDAYKDKINLLIAKMAYAKQTWKEAEIAWKNVLENQSGKKSVDALIFLARIAINRKDSDLAAQYYLQILQIKPNFEEAIVYSIRAALNNSDPKMALSLLEDNWDSIAQPTRINLKMRAYALEDPERALVHYRQEVEKDQDDLPLKIGFIGFLISLKRFKEAAERISLYLEEQPDILELNQLYLQLLQLKPASVAQQLIQAEFTLSLKPTDVNLLNTVGGLLASNNRRSSAVLLYEKAIRIVPDAAILWRNGTYHKAMSNQLEDAVVFANEAIKYIGTKDAEQLTNAAWVLLAASEDKRALGFLKKAIKLNPDSLRAHELVVNLYMDAGNYYNAWQHIQKIDTLELSRRTPRQAYLSAQCIAAFRATSTKPKHGKKIQTELSVMPVRGLFPEKLFDSIVKNSIPDKSSDRRGIQQVTSSLGAGGAERQVAYVMQGMAKVSSGDEICSLVSNSLNPQTKYDFFLPEIEKYGCDVTSLDSLRESSEVRNILAEFPEHADTIRKLASLPLDASRVALPFFAHLIRTRPRVVHLWQDYINVIGGITAIAAGVPEIVLCTRSTHPVEISRVRRYLYDGYHALFRYKGKVTIVNNSSNGARDYEDWLGLETGSIHVFYNGYDFAELRSKTKKGDRERIRKPFSIPNSAKVIGGVMRFSSEKRPDLWVKTLCAAVRKTPDIHGLIVGDGPMRNFLMEKVKAEGLADRIHFAGRRSPVEPWMSAMDILFLSSATEGLPNVLIEAQALGVPVATMNVGGAPEALDVGKSGFTLEEASAEELANRIIQRLDHKKTMSSMSKSAVKFVNAQFSLTAMINTIEELYSGELLH